MADKRTSEETAAAALDGTELVRITQSGESRRTTAAAIADLAADDVTTIDGTTTGSVVIQQHVNGAGLKTVAIRFVGYRNSTGAAQTYDFPTAFDHAPLFWPNSDPECAADTATLTLPASMSGAIDDFAELKGF